MKTPTPGQHDERVLDAKCRPARFHQPAPAFRCGNSTERAKK
jgi:hypothetical protein